MFIYFNYFNNDKSIVFYILFPKKIVNAVNAATFARVFEYNGTKINNTYTNDQETKIQL